MGFVANLPKINIRITPVTKRAIKTVEVKRSIDRPSPVQKVFLGNLTTKKPIIKSSIVRIPIDDKLKTLSVTNPLREKVQIVQELIPELKSLKVQQIKKVVSTCDSVWHDSLRVNNPIVDFTYDKSKNKERKPRKLGTKIIENRQPFTASFMLKGFLNLFYFHEYSEFRDTYLEMREIISKYYILAHNELTKRAKAFGPYWISRRNYHFLCYYRVRFLHLLSGVPTLLHF